MIDAYGDWFQAEHAWAMPVVAETYDESSFSGVYPADPILT